MKELKQQLTERAEELQKLHSDQVDRRNEVSISTRAETLGRLREVRRIIKQLKQ